MFESRGATCESSAPGRCSFVHWGAICEEVNDATVRKILNDNEVEAGEQQESALAQYIVTHAKILFALADRTDALHLTQKLVTSKITDDYLPIEWDEDQDRAKSLSGGSKDDEALDWFSPSSFDNPRKHRAWIENFYQRQREFLAPIFTDIEIVYPLHKHCPLPFTY